MPPSPITILVVDDSVLVRSGLKTLLETSDDLAVVGEANNGQEAIELSHELRPGVILLDIRMPVLDGISALDSLTEIAPVLMLTHSEDDESVQRALRNGASGYLVHGAFDIAELESAIHKVIEGTEPPLSPAAAKTLVATLRDSPSASFPEVGESSPLTDALGLTPRESELLSLISEGLSNSDIANQIFVSEKTVKNHVTHIYAKLGVSTRAAAVALWHQRNQHQL